MKTIFLSSGQGSFMPGMGQAEYDRIPIFRSAIDEIGNLSGEDLPSLCWGTRRNKVKNDPYLNHIVLWATNFAISKTFASVGIVPDILMGHSLGEIIAFCLSGAFSLNDACKLIARRGKLFAENKERSDSDLIAVIGETEKLNNFMLEINSFSNVYPANFNTPIQTVFAISNKDTETFLNKVRFTGLKAIPLKIGNGCHSPYVADIQGSLSDFIDTLDIVDPVIPVFSCVSSNLVNTAQQVREVLKKHVISPVHWWKSLDTLANIWGNNIQLVDLSYSNTIKGLVLGCNIKVRFVQAERLLKETVYAE